MRALNIVTMDDDKSFTDIDELRIQTPRNREQNRERDREETHKQPNDTKHESKEMIFIVFDLFCVLLVLLGKNLKVRDEEVVPAKKYNNNKGTERYRKKSEKKKNVRTVFKIWNSFCPSFSIAWNNIDLYCMTCTRFCNN